MEKSLSSPSSRKRHMFTGTWSPGRGIVTSRTLFPGAGVIMATDVLVDIVQQYIHIDLAITDARPYKPTHLKWLSVWI